MNITTSILTGIALSMDAMSISLVYGTLGINTRKSLLLSTIVGLYHFLMPIVGNYIGNGFSDNFYKYNNKVIGIIFIALVIQMIISLKSEKKIKLSTGLIPMLLFGLSVSLDSLTVGVGLGLGNNNIIMNSIVFSTVSCGLTFIGTLVGKKIHKSCGQTSIVIGIIILSILAINYLIT